VIPVMRGDGRTYREKVRAGPDRHVMSMWIGESLLMVSRDVSPKRPTNSREPMHPSGNIRGEGTERSYALCSALEIIALTLPVRLKRRGCQPAECCHSYATCLPGRDEAL
jgi:hypothetical protein